MQECEGRRHVGVALYSTSVSLRPGGLTSQGMYIYYHTQAITSLANTLVLLVRVFHKAPL